MAENIKFSETYKKDALKKLDKIREKRTAIEQIEKKIIKEIKTIEKTIEKEAAKTEEKAEKWVKEPKHIRVLKVIAILIAIGLIGYLVTVNFLISKDFNYFYDIGSPEDAKKPYLTPSYRVSEIIEDTAENYRLMTSGLVYFNVNIPRGSETIAIQARFKDNFPNNSKMSIGAKDQDIWHYKYNLIYDNSKDNSTNNQWIVKETEFKLNEDSLVVIKNQLSVLFNLPHFSKTEYINNTIPIDWINITVHKPGLFEKWGGWNWKAKLYKLRLTYINYGKWI